MRWTRHSATRSAPFWPGRSVDVSCTQPTRVPSRSLCRSGHVTCPQVASSASTFTRGVDGCDCAAPVWLDTQCEREPLARRLNGHRLISGGLGCLAIVVGHLTVLVVSAHGGCPHGGCPDGGCGSGPSSSQGFRSGEGGDVEGNGRGALFTVAQRVCQASTTLSAVLFPRSAPRRAS